MPYNAPTPGRQVAPVRRAFLPDRSSMQGTPAVKVSVDRGRGSCSSVPLRTYIAGVPQGAQFIGEWGAPRPFSSLLQHQDKQYGLTPFDASPRVCLGAGGGGRTLMSLRTRDFETVGEVVEV